MKKVIIFTIVALFMLTVSTLTLSYATFIDYKPDVILMLVVYIAIESERASDIFLAFILGYLHDIFSGNPIGLFAMLRTVSFVTARFLNLNFFAKNRFFFVVTTFIVSIFDSIYLGYQFNSNGYGFFMILLDSLYISSINSLVAFFVYPVFVWFQDIYLKTLKEQEGRY